MYRLTSTTTAPKGARQRRVTITDIELNLKGATATSSYKPATMETGLVVMVPPFVRKVKKIKINTDSGRVYRAHVGMREGDGQCKHIPVSISPHVQIVDCRLKTQLGAKGNHVWLVLPIRGARADVADRCFSYIIIQHKA